MCSVVQALNFFSFDAYSKAFMKIWGPDSNVARFSAGACAGRDVLLVHGCHALVLVNGCSDVLAGVLLAKGTPAIVGCHLYALVH